MSDYNDGAFDIRRFEMAKTARAPYEARWQEIAERIFPRQSNTFFGNTLGANGGNRNRKMVDVTGAKAIEKFVAICESISTPRMQRWHRLKATNRDVQKDRSARLWFDEATEVLFQKRYDNYSGFTDAQYQSNASVGAFGTGYKFVEPSREKHRKGLRYRCVPLGQGYIALNYHGRPDTFFWPRELNARQFQQQFNKDSDFTPQAIINELTKVGGPDENKTFTIVHVVSPRSDFNPDRIDMKGMEWRGRYIFHQTKEIIREEGFHTWPFPIGRYFSAPGELYSRGPGDMALGSIKLLNEEKYTTVKAGQRAVDPIYIAHDDGVADAFNATPGFVNPGGVTSDGKPLIQALQTGRYDVAKDMMEMEQKNIEDIFLNTLFQILVDNPEMTAEQFIGLMQEKGQLLAPVAGRMFDYDLGPMIDRELDCLGQQGLLPPMPGILKEAQGEYSIAYDSPLSRLQKAEETSGFMRVTSWALNIAAQTKDPSKLDRFNFDAAIPEIADQQAVPERWIRSDEELADLRQQQQDANDTQTAIQAAPAAAQVVKAVTAAQGGARGA
ncbi:portal protein [Hyphomicrobium sp. DY-1]|uniref:portal protein n=1 Tax=Hyphomicrobium sp. DY-1 TaxID=3075650 RepID=UPI0039C2C447